MASATTKKKLFWYNILIKISYLAFFRKFSVKRILCPLGHVFNIINRGIVQKPDGVGI